MVSKIGWIDFSPLQRVRVKKFMDLMGLGGVQDELGVGIIRDAMSNKISPGFSTLYTRAKYFFITPYILFNRDSTQRKNQSGKDYFKKAEIEINKTIVHFYQSHPERLIESFLGKEKKDGQQKRQPSEIYWNGIITFHLIDCNSTLDQLLHDRPSTIKELLSNNQGDDITKEQGEKKGSNPVCISYSTDWKNELENHGLTLNLIEAETLRDRLKMYTPDSLPAELVSNPIIWEKYKLASTIYKDYDKINNPMVHFIKNAYKLIENDKLRANLIAAHDMSLFLHGPHIAYNIRLWEKANASESLIQKRREEGCEWLRSLKTRMIDYEHFDINNCMANTNVKPPTKSFLKEVQTVISKSDNWLEIETELCDLVERQERWNKKAKSRFAKLDKEQMIEEMKKEQWLGLHLINYRYTATLSVVKDIYEGLNTTVK